MHGMYGDLHNVIPYMARVLQPPWAGWQAVWGRGRQALLQHYILLQPTRTLLQSPCCMGRGAWAVWGRGRYCEGGRPCYSQFAHAHVLLQSPCCMGRGGRLCGCMRHEALFCGTEHNLNTLVSYNTVLSFTNQIRLYHVIPDVIRAQYTLTNMYHIIRNQTFSQCGTPYL